MSEKQTINIADLFKKRPDIQSNYDKGRVKMVMEDIIDRPIYLRGYRMEKDIGMTGREEEFCIMTFELVDDEECVQHFIKTQSRTIIENLQAIPEDVYNDNDIVAIVNVKRLKNGGKKYFFNGRE